MRCCSFVFEVSDCVVSTMLLTFTLSQKVCPAQHSAHSTNWRSRIATCTHATLALLCVVGLLKAWILSLLGFFLGLCSFLNICHPKTGENRVILSHHDQLALDIWPWYCLRVLKVWGYSKLTRLRLVKFVAPAVKISAEISSATWSWLEYPFNPQTNLFLMY